MITNPENLVKVLAEDPSQIPQETKDQYVNNFRNQLIMIQESIRQQKLNDAINNTLVCSYAISSTTNNLHKHINDNSTAEVNFIYVPAHSFPDSLVEVTEEDMRAYYEKNKSHLKSKNERKVKYILFPVVPSADDSARFVRRSEKIHEDLTKVNTIEERDSIFSIKVNEYVGTEHD